MTTKNDLKSRHFLLTFFSRAKKTDLNPLDYFFLVSCKAKHFQEKPQSLEEVKEVIENVATSFCTIWRATANLRKRVTRCTENNGGFSSTSCNLPDRNIKNSIHA